MVLLLAVGAWFYLQVRAGREAVDFQSDEQRRTVQDLPLDTPQGELALDDFRGKLVLIDVWASWCAPCLKAVPHLIELQKQYEGDLVVIGLNVDTDGWSAVERFRRHFPDINYLIARPSPEPLIVGTIVDLTPLGKVSVLPTAFLLDREGGLVAKYVGEPETRQAPADIERLLRRR